MTDEWARDLHYLLTEVVAVAKTLKAEFGFEPLRESIGARELALEIRAGDWEPIREAYSLAEHRLVAAGDQIDVAAELILNRRSSVHASTALARTALETSSRVS